MLPKFLCIGATKAGTTWLYLNLRDHPQLWLPPVKEMHYFDWSGYRPTLLRQLHNYRGQLNRAYRFYRYREFRRPAQPPAAWWLRFWLQPRSDGWYAAQFAPSAGQLPGEIAPTYVIQSREQVATIQRMLPDTKLIYIMRDPIARSWSQLQMIVRDTGRRAPIDDATIRHILQTSVAHASSNYIAQIEKWEQFYPADAFFFGFYEQLTADPKTFLRSIYRFLGVDIASVSKHLMQTHNVGRYEPIPHAWAAWLARHYHPSLWRLHARFDNASTAAWLHSAEGYLHA